MYLSRRQRLIVAAGVALGVGLLAFSYTRVADDTPDLAVTGNEAIEDLIPGRGDEILRQDRVGIDLAPGYTGRLEINGTAIPLDQLIIVEALNRVEYQPLPGQVIEELERETCVTAFFWRTIDEGENAESVNWCFEAT